MKSFLLWGFFFFSAVELHSQCAVSFCDSINNYFQCTRKDSVFFWKGDRIKVHVMLNKIGKWESVKMKFDIFYMMNDREGELYAKLTLHPRTGWKSTYKSIYLIKPGRYKVQVFNDDDKQVGEGYLTLLDKGGN